jgi:hypothetical protein
MNFLACDREQPFLTNPDSRNVKTPRSYTQGYNAQAVVNEFQIVLASEVSASSPDFGHLQPMEIDDVQARRLTTGSRLAQRNA